MLIILLATTPVGANVAVGPHNHTVLFTSTATQVQKLEHTQKSAKTWHSQLFNSGNYVQHISNILLASHRSILHHMMRMLHQD